MRGSIRGLAIAGIVLSVLLGMVLIIVGAIFIGGAENLLKEAAKSADTWKAWSDAGLTTVDAVKAFGTKFLVPGIVVLIGLVADILMIVAAKPEKPSRVFGIIAGALGVLCGEIFTTIAGVLCIVHSAKNGK